MPDTKTLAGGERTDAPSAWRISNALTAWNAARESLLDDDPTLERDEEALSEILGPAEGDINDILARVLRAKVHAESMKDAAHEREKAISARKKRYEAREESMKNLSLTLMETLGRRKVELSDLTATITKGRQGVIITDLAKVPDIYVEVIPEERKPDKLVMAADMKAGKTIEGAELSNGANYVTIRKA